MLTHPLLFSSNPFNGQTFYICLAFTLVPGDLLVDFSPDILYFISDNAAYGDLFPQYISPGGLFYVNICDKKESEKLVIATPNSD